MTTMTKPARRLLLATFALLALAISACTSAAPGSIDVSGTRQMSVDRGYALSSVNAVRAANGLQPLRYSERLDQAALRQARVMAARDRMSHDIEGKLSGRVSYYGYSWGAIAENIGYGYSDTQAAMEGWKNSPGHYKNIVNPRVTEAGFAMAMGSNNIPYWAMVFGTEAKRMLVER